MNAEVVVEVGGAASLSMRQIEAVAHRRAQVRVSGAARKRVQAMREAAETATASSEETVYGLNTGFGSNFRDRVTDLTSLQRNLIRSHCTGVGPLAPAEVVRATMLMRAASLARGCSIVRPEVIDKLVELLNKDIVPAVPRFGSVSASGDLAPLSHIAAVLMGEGRVMVDGAAMPTGDFLSKAEARGAPAFEPIVLQMKEGLALNNGCQYANAWTALAASKMQRLIEAAALTTALSVQATRGMGRPFRADLHALRPHPGAQTVARWVYALLEDYSFQDIPGREKAAYDGRIQDPYNLRCAAQILGPCLDLIQRAQTTVEIEANSVTDNPIDLNTAPENYDPDLITSGGHFHGMPLAVEAYGLLQAAGIMARLTNMRCARIVDKNRNSGLGPQVRGAAPEDEAGKNAYAIRSGLMILEYTTAGLCNQIWGLASPSHLMSLSTDSGQEDHVSMAANVAIRADEAADRLAEALAIEMAFALQAGEVRRREPNAWGDKRAIEVGKYMQAALNKIEQEFSPVVEDRELSWDVMKLAEAVLSGEIVDSVREAFARH